MTKAEFGKLLRALLFDLPLAAGRPEPQQTLLVKLSGKSTTTVSDWCNGRAVPQPGTLRKMLDGLMTNPSFGYQLWPGAHQARFRSIDGQLMRISRLHATKGHLAYLQMMQLSAAAYQDASVVSQTGAEARGRIALDQLYVRRNVEQSVIDKALGAEAGSAQLITGEPGCGKTSLLWSLYGRLGATEGVEPLFVRASYLIEGLMRQQSPTGVTADDITAAARCSQRIGNRPVVLVDTLDLLVAQPKGVAVVQDLLSAMDRWHVPVVLTCRPEEAVELQFPPQADGVHSAAATEDAEAEAESVAFRRPQIMLGLYSDNERNEAVRRHADVFCPDTQYGPGAAERLEADILGAVYQGLPVKEVCTNPLYLRLLFDLYAPNPPLQQVDAGGLFDLVRVERVQRDARAGGEESVAGRGLTGSEEPTGRKGAAHVAEEGDFRADWDLTRTAQALARYMLSANTIEYRSRDAGDALERLLPGVPRPRIGLELAELRRRGLVTDAPAGGLRFFHQTFFEFMAAEYLRTAGRGAELVTRMTTHPQDLVLAAVAGQLIPRADPGADSALLRPLLEDEVLSDRALEWYADMRAPGASDAAAAHTALRRASPHSLKRFVERLPGHVHPTGQRWVEDLTVVWPLTEQQPALRRTLFTAVGRLASQHPYEAVDFFAGKEQRMSWWVKQGSQPLKTHKPAWLALFAALFPHDPEEALGWLSDVCRVLAGVGAYGIVADAVDQVEDCVRRISPSARHASLRQLALPGFESILDERPAKVPKGVADLEQSVGRLWADAQPATEAVAREQLTAALLKGDRGAGRARLHGAGRLAALLSVERAQQAVGEVLDVRSPAVQTVALTHVLVPALVGPANSFRDAVDASCRAALAALPCPAKEADGSRNRAAWLTEAVEKAVEAGLGPDRLAALLPDDDTPALWLAPGGLTDLLGAAAAAGHRPALAVLKTWAGTAPKSRTEAGWAVARISTSLLDHLTDDVLTHLVQDALHHQPLRELTTLVEAAASLAPPPNTVPEIEALTKDLGTSEQIQLWRTLVKHWSWLPPAPNAAARALAAGDSRYTSMLLLVEECASHPSWEWQQLEQLIEQLRKDTKTRPERQAGASSPHRALAALLTRRHPLAAAEASIALDTVLDLTLPAGETLGSVDATCARLAAEMLGRVAAAAPELAARGLVTAARRLGSHPNGVSDNFAKFTASTVGATLARLGAGARRRLVVDLAHSEPAMGNVAVTAFSMLAGTTAQPPTWYQALGNDTTLPPQVRSTVTSHLHRHARIRCGGPWLDLMTAEGAMT
ncbi:NACHT domain-containing protein [Streptomyces hydrogenans]|uniref:NACHT domain-containing protein n=1 Tax=Streptomyces hydrogenans TaxID=1873719 RepID=UPI0036A67E77